MIVAYSDLAIDPNLTNDGSEQVKELKHGFISQYIVSTFKIISFEWFVSGTHYVLSMGDSGLDWG